MSWRDTPQDTEIIFIGGGQVMVRGRPEKLDQTLLNCFIQVQNPAELDSVWTISNAQVPVFRDFVFLNPSQLCA